MKYCWHCKSCEGGSWKSKPYFVTIDGVDLCEFHAKTFAPVTDFDILTAELEN